MARYPKPEQLVVVPIGAWPVARPRHGALASARTLWQEYLGPSELGGSSLEEVLLSLLLVVLLNLLEKFLGEFLRFCELFRGHFLG